MFRDSERWLATFTSTQTGKSIAIRLVSGKRNFNRTEQEEQIMLRPVGLFLIFLTMSSAFGQSTSKYQVGTITEVKVHQTAGSGASDTASYDVSVKVGDTVYVVLYTPALGEETVKYAAGRDLLVLVGKNKITYNDILGQSHDVLIESQKPALKPKQSKSVSRTVD
jgi:hypothetical protein